MKEYKIYWWWQYKDEGMFDCDAISLEHALVLFRNNTFGNFRIYKVYEDEKQIPIETVRSLIARLNEEDR